MHSVRFRNAARAGLGLALAVLVAKTASVEHSFWVVLAALSVLRSNALGTGATALQALAGALVGFGVAAALMETMGGDDTWLWIALPIVVFLAAYTPGAVNFVVGQAGFTVFVVVLFNILVPDGWRTGLVRVQDIAIGAGISVAVGALLWPRGARGVARRSFAELLRAAGAHLSLALPSTSPSATSRVTLRLPRPRRPTPGPARSPRSKTSRWSTAAVTSTAKGGVSSSSRRSCSSSRPTALVRAAPDRRRPAVALPRQPSQAKALRWCGRSTRRPSSSWRPGSGRSSRPDQLRRPVPEALTRCLGHQSPAELPGALGLVWVHEWLALAADHVR